MPQTIDFSDTVIARVDTAQETPSRLLGYVVLCPPRHLHTVQGVAQQAACDARARHAHRGPVTVRVWQGDANSAGPQYDVPPSDAHVLHLPALPSGPVPVVAAV